MIIIYKQYEITENVIRYEVEILLYFWFKRNTKKLTEGATAGKTHS